MSTHGLLPGGGVRLLPNVDGPLPIDPKYKATILYFMFLAELAQYEAESDREMHALHDFAHIVASTLLNTVYGVHVHPDSIKSYYRGAIANAKAEGKWDQHAVAEIISTQVQDQQTFDEVTLFLSTADRVSSYNPIMVHHCFASTNCGPQQDHWNTLALTEQFFLSKLSKAMSGTRGISTTYIKFESYWLGATRSKNRRAPLIRDPELPPSRGGMDFRTASGYGDFLEFEYALSHGRRSNTDD